MWTLHFLFKCLRSSMYVRFVDMLRDCDTRCFVQVSRVVHTCVFIHMFRDCDTCCFAQVSRVVHTRVFVHMFRDCDTCCFVQVFRVVSEPLACCFVSSA